MGHSLLQSGAKEVIRRNTIFKSKKSVCIWIKIFKFFSRKEEKL